MNCKEGDIAMFKAGVTNAGGLCEARTRYYGYEEACWLVVGLSSLKDVRTGAVLQPGTVSLAADQDLIPLRDRPGEDEMLRIAGKPKETEPKIDDLWGAARRLLKALKA